MQAPSRLSWYVRRLGRMSPAELAWRARDEARQAAWARRQVSRAQLAAGLPPTAAAGSARAAGGGPPGGRRFGAVLPPDAAAAVPAEARTGIIAAAGRLLAGQWEVLGVERTDLISPDWFADPVTGRSAPADRYAFRINHRSEEQTGNVKQVWEISRLHHLTLLAMAWYLTGDDRCAGRIDEQLRSWWQDNPFLSGVHWTSGIEIGIRLISLTWIRRLLDGWPGVGELFEDNDLAVQQIRWHQEYLAAFRSRGSSANNHVIAEAAGQLAASCAFPWYPESDRWRQAAASLLEQELVRNTFPSGIGRELASDYHAFVAELGLVAAIEADASGHPLSRPVLARLCAMVDSAAALLDDTLRPPRQGDGDEGRALLLDAPDHPAWPSLLALGESLFGALPWWPKVLPDARSAAVSALTGPAWPVDDRPEQRPAHFADAGLTLLRTASGDEPEIWCRCDGGPHGYLSIAAHAHADALSVEVRCGGVDILADPGTYCYHGEPEWRSYFRSTLGHNTVEIAGQSQSAEGGPFLWLQQAQTRQLGVADAGETARWSAEHDGYASLTPPARHCRSVELDRSARSVTILDEITGSHDVRVAFHLGPAVTAELSGHTAELAWPDAAGPGRARFTLPRELRWSLHRGETDPVIAGWYSAGLGQREPAITLIGTGRVDMSASLRSCLEFAQAVPLSTGDERH
ncbi:MAG TPA: alginate lyase family protein [Streptosporangiaceae bacterium]|jgi:hypothetical protein|nr:alginate lyase family protein [Streptosporangiaceae bacterium]